ncbi:acyl-CoA dehydrogenase [Alicyclobacillus macrosporangiidus]|uniref:Acyl-CoA dehydrogenase n=1 Tax=Alicyclobacillus macrosporangiidus TaxID=392015 RepID=A0A1I7HT12_9BACL|nr:acyl-CoA dehydrogenase [Alicyclobacillus macrosporangiidus]SFU63719.1 Acyl-CoA dehydrogenase [Alicyclobacillus macrosporangiidus]
MDFTLTAEQSQMRQLVRSFARDVIAPRASEIDRTDRFPRDLIRQMGELGLMGLPIPEAYGGVGADYLSYVLAIEEISYASAAVGVILAVHTSVGTFPILYFGTDAQRQRYLPKLASGEWVAAFALTEPDAGSDAAAIRTRAVRDGDDYVINGNKVFITNASDADLFCVFAVTDTRRGKRGLTAFLVERGTPGLVIGRKLEKMGLNGSGTCELVFEDMRVPAENRLGQEGEGFSIAMRLLDGGRIGIAAQGLGIARAAFDAAHAYVRRRRQFGQEIFQFQGVQFMLADMATKIEAARWLVYHAAVLRQNGQPCTREASMAKLFATDTAMQVTTDAVQLFGGYGYVKEYPVERYMRDAKVTQIYEGTNQIQRMVIARHLPRA